MAGAETRLAVRVRPYVFNVVDLKTACDGAKRMDCVRFGAAFASAKRPVP